MSGHPAPPPTPPPAPAPPPPPTTRKAEQRFRTLFCATLVTAGLLLCFGVLFFSGPDNTPAAFRRSRVQGDTDIMAGHGTRWNEAGSSAGKRLAVVVPVHMGDFAKGLASLAKWPTRCSPITQTYVDLILYKAEAWDLASVSALSVLEDTAGKCFANTKIIFGALTDEENVYPDGPSVQFYKIFLDPKVKSQFAEYDVFAIIEWDVLVVHDDSFARLYEIAFHEGEAYWVKGSVLAGTNFHNTAAMSSMWHVMGHINGNAMYNNEDPAFAEFVDYTLARWKFKYPYDVALWATIADFPYSWPLWQRYSIKFVNTNVIGNVGFMDVADTTVLAAVERGTLFIHGSTTGSGSRMFTAGGALGISATPKLLDIAMEIDQAEAASATADLSNMNDYVCKAPCGGGQTPPVMADAVEGAVFTVCDPSCAPGTERGVRFDGHMCGAGDANTYGASCRACFTDPEVALQEEEKLRLADADAGGGEGKELGGVGRGGLEAKHVIMCDTMRPPPAMDCSQKCGKKIDTVCDNTCGTGRYDDYNCDWRDRGTPCRFCFNDVDQALQADEVARKVGGRVIMCDTHEPPRLLPVIGTARVAKANGMAANVKATVALHDAVRPGEQTTWSRDPSLTPFGDDMVRGDLCAFIPGYFQFISETEATVQSVVHFMNGMRVRVAVHPNDFYVYNDTLGEIPGVKVVSTDWVATSGLLADKFCGPDETLLIYYLFAGQLLSRTIHYKDTHSPRGELLVVYTDTDSLADVSSGTNGETTAAVLGFSPPSFTYGTDIVLPTGVHAQLRDVLITSHGSKKDQGAMDDDTYAAQLLGQFQDVSVLQLLASVAYARNTQGVWFVNPEKWVTHHLFADASIWDIPLVKPRFGCSLDMSLAIRGYDMGAALQTVLNNFKSGITCETGYLSLDVSTLHANPNVEFGEAAGGTEQPPMEEYNISVLYSLTDGDDVFLGASLESVAKHFPQVSEVVLVASASIITVLRDVVSGLPSVLNGTISVRFVTDPGLPRPGGWDGVDEETAQRRLFTWRRMNADRYCSGEYVVHLDPTTVLFTDVTYDGVFHFNKLVMPYRRHPEGEWDHLVSCRRNESVLVFDEPVENLFVMFDAKIFPRGMYSELRRFIGELHGMPFANVVSASDHSWVIPGQATDCSMRERDMLLPDYEFMGAFMWYKMHNEVCWMATDPRDIKRDDWATDVYRYSWACSSNEVAQAGLLQAPKTASDYLTGISRVYSPYSCLQFRNKWLTPSASQQRP